jgi:hypothetical protein
MNEVHLRGRIKAQPWTYNGNLCARVAVPRSAGRPGRSREEGGDFDYVTLIFPGGARSGLRLEEDQIVTAHGWLQSRDVHQDLADFLQRAEQNGHQVSVEARVAGEVKAHRTVTEVVVERWDVEGGRRGERKPRPAKVTEQPADRS